MGGAAAAGAPSGVRPGAAQAGADRGQSFRRLDGLGHAQGLLQRLREEVRHQVVETSPADFGKLRAMVESGNVEWDVTEIGGQDAIRAIKLGLVEKIDDKIVDLSTRFILVARITVLAADLGDVPFDVARTRPWRAACRVGRARLEGHVEYFFSKPLKKALRMAAPIEPRND